MKSLVLAIVATVAAVSTAARAAPLVVVVREASGDALAVARLRGQLADLDVRVAIAPGAIESALGGQLAAASRLAATYHARAVVWFLAREGGLAVAIATPGDRRLFVREIPAASSSAVAEAAAVAARGAIRAIGEGGTIGVELAPAVDAERPPPPVVTEPETRTGFELSIGWQVALDAGADRGAQAVAQRTSAIRGPWAGSLALTLGPALRRSIDSDLAIELSRSAATLGLERRAGGFAFGVAAGAAIYHRTTIATASGFMATPAATTAAFIAGPELRWQWRPGTLHLGVDAAAGLDVVVGAPELAVDRGGGATGVQPLGQLRMYQPRFSLSIIAGLP